MEKDSILTIKGSLNELASKGLTDDIAFKNGSVDVENGYYRADEDSDNPKVFEFEDLDDKELELLCDVVTEITSERIKSNMPEETFKCRRMIMAIGVLLNC